MIYEVGTAVIDQSRRFFVPPGFTTELCTRLLVTSAMFARVQSSIYARDMVAAKAPSPR